MALIVEDGTGLPTAESYCSVAVATAYHAARGNAAWSALTDPVKEQSLRKATDFMATYRWRGYRVSAPQALDWPRYGAMANGHPIDMNVVPAAVANACAELALRASASPLVVDVESAEAQSKTVGPISVTYARSRNNGQKAYPQVDSLLSAYVVGGSGQVRLVRA